ncbi:PREDICTED: sugar transporter ERD6-like 8 isoform X2 [Nelumbo nucifera]|uniref:Sugar transporter ERD6-like 8 isoform X2 n=1 Tax=Nelumbo nucifera TaxID=4432 RepID=A0A1U8PY46_NELNU|nr:PREDICTED: sugar transporter ERD6-like 8 isoform X2 [Nelumbo nucifera]
MARNREVEHGNDVFMSQPLMGTQSEETESHVKHKGLRMVLLTTSVAVCGSFEFGSCVGYSAPTQFGIMKDIGLSLTEYSVFGSILNIGAVIGAMTSGHVADFIGRKGAMRMSSTICILGWLWIYLSRGAVSLDIGRFLMGYGIGILSYVVPVFIAEITPKNLRGALATANQLLIVIGISVSFTLGAFLTWRALALIGIVPCILLIVGLQFIPESPRWLAKVSRKREFESALRTLRGEGADISQEKCEIEVGVGLMVFQQLGGINAIVFYASQIFASAGFPPKVVVTALGASLIDRAGRRPLLLVSASGLFLGSFLLGISFYLKASQLSLNWVPVLALSGVLVYIGSFSVGMGAVPWVIMSEIFPINLKGIAGSLVTLVNWLGSWLVSYTFNFLSVWSTYGAFFVYSAICAIGIGFIFKVVPETKGRTLEEIQASMNS